MFCKIANANDLSMFSMNEDMVYPELDTSNREVIFLSIQETIKILSESYGERRSFESVGGFVVVFYGEADMQQRKMLMDYYNLYEDCYEYKDTVTDEVDGWCWYSEAYIGTDYNVVMYYRSACDE